MESIPAAEAACEETGAAVDPLSPVGQARVGKEEAKASPQTAVDDAKTIAAVRRFIRTGKPIRWLGTLDELRIVNRRNAGRYVFSLNHLVDDQDIVRAFETRDCFVAPPLVDVTGLYVQRNGGLATIDLIDDDGAYSTHG